MEMLISFLQGFSFCSSHDLYFCFIGINPSQPWAGNIWVWKKHLYYPRCSWIWCTTKGHRLKQLINPCDCCCECKDLLLGTAKRRLFCQTQWAKACTIQKDDILGLSVIQDLCRMSSKSLLRGDYTK